MAWTDFSAKSCHTSGGAGHLLDVSNSVDVLARERAFERVWREEMPRILTYASRHVGLADAHDVAAERSRSRGDAGTTSLNRRLRGWSVWHATWWRTMCGACSGGGVWPIVCGC